MATATDEPRSEAPARGGLVLSALIAVAAVANLGLAVANVALPSIGEHFDASQTALNLVAVGYSLGLAASVLYFGAVGDRYGRKLLLVLGMILTIPADCLAAWAPSIEVLFGARCPRRSGGGNGVPDDARPDHGALVGPGAYEVDRALGSNGRSDRLARPVVRRRSARALLVGLGLPDHPAAGGDRARDGGAARAQPREREQ
jgi:MFS family permease